MQRLFLLTILLLSLIKLVKAQYCDITGFISPKHYDTYFEFEQDQPNWQHFNVHDPTVYKDSVWYYMYNTDVGMGYDPGTGALKRKSKDLVNWEFLGQAFDGIPESARQFFLQYNPDYTNSGIWAPYLTKFKDEYRLYYSAPGGLNNTVLAFIGLATSSSANGPWEDKGKITSAIPGDTINAIDPSVVIDSITRKHWMVYGSYQTGIYIVELDSMTGTLKTEGDRGVRIAGRYGGRHAAIEGPELIYRNGWYYLFVSYDWLEDKYNVRVGRSKNPEGPYYDINGKNMADYNDNYPMILTPYAFRDHSGWQGTGHCGVINDSGQYFMFHQARPTNAIYNMVLHTRKIFWINDWPVVSPERYAAVPQCSIVADSLVGKWERILLTYTTSIKTSVNINLIADGTIDNNPENTWTLEDSLLIINWNNGIADSLIVSYGLDWEYDCLTLLFTGLNSSGQAIWGKKLNQEDIARYTEILPGEIYQIRNHHSNMLMELPGGTDVIGTTIKQGIDKNDSTQAWRILATDDGYFQLSPLSSSDQKVIAVYNGSSANGALIKLEENDTTDQTKFKIIYNNNGYFRILTKVSGNKSCLDLYEFSISPGGVIAQWSYLEGLNQMWRFKRISYNTTDTTNNNPTNAFHKLILSDVKIYPNPNYNGSINLDIPEQQNILPVHMTIFNNSGVEIYRSNKLQAGKHSLDVKLQPGIYILYVQSELSQQVKKLVVY